VPARRSVLTLFIILFAASIASAQSSSESKIKNAKLLVEKAISAQGEARADYAYKAKREFERAAGMDTENPVPIYWQAVIASYFEGDSAASEKLYERALKIGMKKVQDLPLPNQYLSEANVLSGLKDDFAWAQKVESPPATPVEEVEPAEKTDPLRLLNELTASGEFDAADSLFKELYSRPKYDRRSDLLLSGLTLKLSEGNIDQASEILEKVESENGRRSKAYKKAESLFDERLDLVIERAKASERRGQYSEAIDSLRQWQPERARPSTPAKGRLLLQVSSLRLLQNDYSGADSILAIYDDLGYAKNEPYRNIRERLTLALRETAPEEPRLEVTRQIAEQRPGASDFVTIAPPQGEIAKVVINTLDASSGKVKSSALWETTAPVTLKTGQAYKIVVQKRQERKTPRYIAMAGILATFLIVR